MLDTLGHPLAWQLEHCHCVNFDRTSFWFGGERVQSSGLTCSLTAHQLYMSLKLSLWSTTGSLSKQRSKLHKQWADVVSFGLAPGLMVLKVPGCVKTHRLFCGTGSPGLSDERYHWRKSPPCVVILPHKPPGPRLILIASEIRERR